MVLHIWKQLSCNIFHLSDVNLFRKNSIFLTLQNSKASLKHKDSNDLLDKSSDNTTSSLYFKLIGD